MAGGKGQAGRANARGLFEDAKGKAKRPTNGPFHFVVIAVHGCAALPLRLCKRF